MYALSWHRLYQGIFRRPEGGRKNGRILTYGIPTAGIYTVLTVQNYYDRTHQGIKILAEAEDGKRSLFWIRYDPIAYVAPPEFCFFEMLISGDRVSVTINDEDKIRISKFYG